MAEVQDLVVVGGGAGGFAAAMGAAQLGGRVTVAESTHYGGNCMNKACIPLTFLATAGHVVSTARRARRFGIELGEPRVDVAALQDRKCLIIEGLRVGTEQLLAEYGITLIEGRVSWPKNVHPCRDQPVPLLGDPFGRPDATGFTPLRPFPLFQG